MKKKKITVAVSGYFNPLHVGHLEMMEKAKKLGDYLIAIVNNDHQVKLKGSVPFLNQADRAKIVGAIRWVDKVFISIDRDKTQRKSLARIKPDIFANGGDRKPDSDPIPEVGVCHRHKIKIVYGLGKKIRSSSILIARASKKVQKK